MDTIDTSTCVDTIDIESVPKKVKLNGGDSSNAKTVDKNDSEEEFDFSSSDLEDLDSVHSAADETDNFNEPLSNMVVKSHDNDTNQLIEAKNDNINMGNGDIQPVTVVNGDTSSLDKCSISLSNECNNQMDSVSTNNSISDINTSAVDDDGPVANDTILNSNDTADTSALTKCEEDDAYSDEDGAIVNFLGKANEIVGLVHMTICVTIHVEELWFNMLCVYFY